MRSYSDCEMTWPPEFQSLSRPWPHCQTSQSHSPAAHGSMQKFDNDYDVVFVC